MRKCKVCEVQQEVKDFPKAGEIKGKVYYRHQCKKCYWDKKNIRRKGIVEWFQEYKKTVNCLRCGIGDHPGLEFHNNKGNKLENISNMAQRGWRKEAILKEIEKCVPLCANCHRIHHFESVV